MRHTHDDEMRYEMMICEYLSICDIGLYTYIVYRLMRGERWWDSLESIDDDDDDVDDDMILTSIVYLKGGMTRDFFEISPFFERVFHITRIFI